MQPETTLNGTPAAAARHRRTGVPISLSTGGWRRFRRTLTDVADRDVYLCASPGVAAAVRSALRRTGLPRRRLHEEIFAF